MINTNITTEMLLQSSYDLGSKCNLREHIQYLPAFAYVFFDLLDIDIRLAAGSNAMQQAGLFGLKDLLNFIKSA